MSLLEVPPAIHVSEDQQERLIVLGQRLTVRVTPQQTNGACYAFDVVAMPGMGVPMHVHDHEDELFLVRRGLGRFVVDGREVIVRPGDSLFGPRGVPHAWEAIGSEPVEGLIVITPGNLEPMFRALGRLEAIDPAAINEICAAHGVRFV